MDIPSTSGQPQKPSTAHRARLIPATPRPEGSSLQSAQPIAIPNIGTSQALETYTDNLYSDIIKEAIAKLKRCGITAEEISSSESSSKAATQSGTKTSPTSSSSLRFSTNDENEAEEGQEKKRTSRTFDEIASEVIREMRKVEEREKRKSKEKQGAGEPLQIPTETANRESQENPIREIHDLTGTDGEEAAASDDWRSQMEDTVNLLIAENAEQNAMLKAQMEQMTNMVNLVDRVISWMERKTQSSNKPSLAVSAAGQNEPPQNVLDTNHVSTSRMRKPTTTTSQPPSAFLDTSASKRTRDSGSPGSQKKN